MTLWPFQLFFTAVHKALLYLIVCCILTPRQCRNCSIRPMCIAHFLTSQWLISRPVLLCTHFMTLFAFVEGSSWPDRFGRPQRHIPFHFVWRSTLLTAFLPLYPRSLSVWVRVCGLCQQFWPQHVLMASEDVKYSWQGLVCAPQPHLERLFSKHEVNGADRFCVAGPHPPSGGLS